MRRLLTVLLLACAAMGFASPAQAHNVLVGSDPADGATLAAPPGRITLEFDQPARQGYAQIGVTGGDGSAWADGAAVVSAEKVSVAVKPLPAGRYVVGYRILSSDGHPVTGKISFTVGGTGASGPADDAAATAPDAAAAAAEAAANGGAGMAVVWIVAALLVLAAGTAVALRRAAPPTPAGPPDAESGVSLSAGGSSDPGGGADGPGAGRGAKGARS